MVEFTAEHRGLCADVVHPRGLGAWAEAACLGAEVGGSFQVPIEHVLPAKAGCCRGATDSSS